MTFLKTTQHLLPTLRKQPLYSICIVCILSLFACKDVNRPEQKKDTRPNIILILADDMGFSDLGCYGGEIETPVLDGLATNGLRMTQFYNASRCCPTRASLLTGLYPHQANMGFMQEDCNVPGYGGFLPDNALTIAELLKENGYETAMSGKWHVGNDPAHWPTQKGFDRFFGFPHHGGEYFAPFISDQFITYGDSIVSPEKDFYSTDAINDNATMFVEEMVAEEAPFFLYLAHVAPHFPLQAKEVDIKKYRGTYSEGFAAIRDKRFERQKTLGIIPSDYPISEIDPKAPRWDDLSEGEKDDFDLRMAVYAAQIDAMDQGIGRLIAKLKALEQLDNTIIVFLSDNGGTREDYSNPDFPAPIGEAESFACYKLPWANVSNTPYRMFKHWGYEGGIKTPFIVHYPKMVQKGTLNDQPGHIIDIMTTFADLAGVSYPKTFQNNPITPMEGKSLLPILKGKTRDGHQGIFWEHEGNQAARMGDWKWVSTYPAYADELYDLSKDPVENDNVAAAHPEQLNLLKNEWQKWADRVGVRPWDEILKAAPEQGRLQIYY